MKIFIYPLLNNAGSPAHKLTHTMKTLINFKKREGENNFELFFESNDLPRVQYFLETKQFDDLMRLSHKEKDETDMLAALAQGRARGYSCFHLYGGLGGMLDHTLANLQLLCAMAQAGEQGFLLDDEIAVTAIDGSKSRATEMIWTNWPVLKN